MTTTSQSPALVWFRDDLRLGDNPALDAACRSGRPVHCLYILDDAGERRRPGGASRWWLAQSLRALDSSLQAIGGRLLVFKGDPAAIIPRLASATDAAAVFWNRRYGAEEIALDARIKEQLKQSGIAVSSFNGNLLNEPWEIATKIGGPMKVFTPYWRTARARGEPQAPLPAPKRIVMAALPAGNAPPPVTVEALGLEPSRPDWSGGLRAEWQAGESGAAARLSRFLIEGLKGYGENRNRPDLPATTRLSPHLRFGEISVREVWHATQHAVLSGETSAPQDDVDKFLSEIGWREFSNHLLFYNPDLRSKNYNPRFDAFPWVENSAHLKAWQRGQTGYPVVDAGMRQLWQTGWMHNRVRMIVGSFLVKHLLIDWREGERWFWDTLVDADPANNTASWQWIAGSGADAAPYFRIFNPVTQGEKFDPDGHYVRTWVPELAKLPTRVLQQPWTAPPGILLAAGVRLGNTYPQPIVDHDFSRQRALKAFQSMKPIA